MPQGRHSLASRNSRAQRLTLIAAPLVTCAVVGAGVALADDASQKPDPALQASSTVAAGAAAAATADRSAPLSRSVERVPVVTAKRWSTADLDLRLAPTDGARTRGEVDSLSRIAVTGVKRAGYAQVVVNKKAYWVTAEYLVAKKPTSPGNLPIVDKPCAGTSGVESGLTAGAIRVYRAVCNNFPQITSYGGRDNHGEHRGGKAIDIMTSDVSLGTAIAEFLRANAAEFNLYSVIWRQRIFTQERGGEGWRSMSSRGSATANHMDHVHVSVY
ncbi:mucin-2 protein [Nocardioides marmoriginsengisoli]|uniref:Mucin-2 protein n=1 Tax=Nocardioides marmoriginsengisoli TaxID=661483 RepID=A0A3N0CNR4_9ACTN|nr:mucin-2 protein [Nocardioides marmoriginsengisoli]RNL64959.1 mucin-2 protein [Nocardioides marmoriginsengisoli]